MRVEGAEVGLDKGLRQCLEALGRAVPGELIGRPGHRSAEFLLQTAAHQRVQAIGRDDQVVSGKLIYRLDRRVVSRRDTDRANPLLQDREQLKPADRGETDAVDRDILAAQIEGDVLPAFHPRRDGVDGVGVVGAQELQRLFGEHHAKTPGGSGGILFEQVDVRVRMTLLPQISEIETSGASPDYGDTHCLLQIDSILFILPRLIPAGQSRQRKISGSWLSAEFLRVSYCAANCPRTSAHAGEREGACAARHWMTDRKST